LKQDLEEARDKTS